MAVLLIGKAQYLAESRRGSFVSESDVAVFRLRSDGPPQEACALYIQPTASEIVRFTQWPALASYIKVLRNIGTAGPSGGSDNSAQGNYNHGIEGAIRRAAVRPWAVSRANPGFWRDDRFVYNKEFEAALESWSYVDPWSRREYLTYLEHREPARSALADYLVDVFGIPRDKAEQLGADVFLELTAAFVQSCSFRQQPAYDDLINEIAAGQLPPLPRDDAEANNALHYCSRRTDLLSFAITSPRLFQQWFVPGPDIDRGNLFEKTALMYAAHLNRPDAIDWLVQRGAGVNLATYGGLLGCTTIDTNKRTALMYAAENAGIEAIARLVDGGADLDAKDSHWPPAGVDAYLARNPRFSDEEKQLGVRALVERYRKQGASRNGPSFDCRKARTRTEVLTCTDEVLTMYDRELADAYHRWQKNSPDDARMRREQLDWLTRRAMFVVG